MTYQSGTLISTADLLHFRGNAAPDTAYVSSSDAVGKVAALVGVGYGDRGYGQINTPLPAVYNKRPVTHVEWNALRTAMGNINVHTGSTLTLQPAVDAGNQIIAETDAYWYPGDGVYNYTVSALHQAYFKLYGGINRSTAPVKIGTIAAILPPAFNPADFALYLFHDTEATIIAADGIDSVLSLMVRAGMVTGVISKDGSPNGDGSIRHIGNDQIPVIG